MIDIVIASYNEPKATLRAVQAFLNQNLSDDFRITVLDPFPEVGEFLLRNVKDDRVKFFLDFGEGKSQALTMVMQEYYSKNKNDIFIFSDGDVHIEEGALKELTKFFKNPRVGMVTGRPLSIDPKNTKYGYWSHLLFAGINRVRKKLSDAGEFFQGTGYLIAIRKGIIFECPEGSADDVMIPYLIWKKGYKIIYAEKAGVYVKNPSNWSDWVNQKVRNIKAHENIKNVASDMPRTKSFIKEIKEGSLFALTYPKNSRELIWSLQLYPARLYVYLKAFNEIRKKNVFRDDWREIEIKSTKPLD